MAQLSSSFLFVFAFSCKKPFYGNQRHVCGVIAERSEIWIDIVSSWTSYCYLWPLVHIRVAIILDEIADLAKGFLHPMFDGKRKHSYCELSKAMIFDMTWIQQCNQFHANWQVTYCTMYKSYVDEIIKKNYVILSDHVLLCTLKRRKTNLRYAAGILWEITSEQYGHVTHLGAGQDVGRSCLLLSIGLFSPRFLSEIVLFGWKERHAGLWHAHGLLWWQVINLTKLQFWSCV